MAKILSLFKTGTLFKAIKEKIGQQRRIGKMNKFYSQFVNKGDLCFDIGANVGDRTGVFLSLGGRVIAVEPQEECVKAIKEKYTSRNAIVINKVLGEKNCEVTMKTCDSDILSSLSEDWIDKVHSSGRFKSRKWDREIKVEMTTLDKLIEEYGVPHFCKIDVEGYELNVLKGLSSPVKALSLEFTPEAKEESIKCIEYLASLGSVVFNYSKEETMVLEFENWVTPKAMKEFLLAREVKEKDKFNWGDIYAKFQ